MDIENNKGARVRSIIFSSYLIRSKIEHNYFLWYSNEVIKLNF